MKHDKSNTSVTDLREHGAFTLSRLTEYQSGSIVSRTIIDKKEGTVTVFAFDAGQSLSEHTAPFDALVQAVEGEGRCTIAGEDHLLKEGQGIIMPANVPHAVRAEERFKMVLTMIRGEEKKSCQGAAE